MATATEDLFDPAVRWNDNVSVGSQTLDFSGSITRVFLVTGLTGAADALGAQALATSGIPALFDAHPSAANFFVSSRSLEFQDKDKARVTVAYNFFSQLTSWRVGGGGIGGGNTGPVNIQVGSSLQTVERSKDVDGNDMVLTHTYPSNYVIDTTTPSRKRGGTEIDVVKAQVGVPQVVIKAQRSESTNSRNNSLTFVGAINDSDIWGYSARTLLCTHVDSTTNNSGADWSVSYEFQYNNDTWDPLFVFFDQEAGKYVIPDGNGEDSKRFKVYPAVNFSKLNLFF